MRRKLAWGVLLLFVPPVGGAAFDAGRREGGSSALLGAANAGGAVSVEGRRDRGSIALLYATTGKETAHLAANGPVVTAIADGRGGWFVGGSFTRLGAHRRVALAHVLSNGAVDPAWRASIGSASGRPVAVHALARVGTRLFVAGPFGRVGGLQRPGLAAVDANTGVVTRSWSPTPRSWPDTQALLVSGPRLLVARQSGYPTPGITALDVRTGAVDRAWDARLLLIGDAGSFNTLLLRGSRLFVAGSFRVAGLPRNGLVALDAHSGARSAFRTTSPELLRLQWLLRPLRPRRLRPASLHQRPFRTDSRRVAEGRGCPQSAHWRRRSWLATGAREQGHPPPRAGRLPALSRRQERPLCAGRADRCSRAAPPASTRPVTCSHSPSPGGNSSLPGGTECWPNGVFYRLVLGSAAYSR